MNVRDYEYIVEIVSQGSIAKAADRLAITAGALSKYLSRIEKELNIQLFKRVGNQFVLTKAGQRYVDAGRAIISIDEQLGRDISDLIENGDASLHLGAPRGMNSFVMEQLLPEFYHLRKDDQITFERGGSQELITMLEDGKLDICIAYASEKRPNLSYQKLGHVEPVLAVPADSTIKIPIQQPGHGRWPELTDDHWLEQPYVSISLITYSGRIADAFFHRKGRKPPVRLYVGDTNTALSAVENGIGNTLLLAVPHTDRLVRFYSVPEMADKGVDVYAITRRNDFHSEGMDALITIAGKYYKALDQ